MIDLLPDALADALGVVVADVRRECRREIDVISAESRATIAELKMRIAELQAQMTANVDQQVTRVSDAVAVLKNGDPGRDADPQITAEIAARLVAAELSEIRSDVAELISGGDAKIAAGIVAAMAALPMPKDGEDGKSVAPADVERLVEERVLLAVGTLRVPSDGHTPTDAELTPLIETAVSRALAERPVPKDGEDGKSVAPADVERLVEERVLLAVGTLRVPSDGHTPTAAELAPLIETAVSHALAERPVPKDGIGREEVCEEVAAEIERVVKLLPAPVDGHTPTDAELAPLIETAVSHAFAARPAPKDGVGLAGALIDRTGSLIVTMTDGAAHNLGPVVGGDGTDGTPGLGFEDLSVVHDGGRGVVFRMARDALVKEFPVVIPAMIYRGVYREDAGGYQRGDVVTIRGSMYHCDADTQDKPGEGSKDWTLAVKNGKDGRDGKNGDPGAPGLEGRPGRDLTQLGPDGKKW